MEILKSVEDDSVNFIITQTAIDGTKLIYECRYVRREQDTIIIYVSSHSGCNLACRFCHLTQTGQTKMIDAEIPILNLQVRTVLDYYDTLNYPAKKVHINFMARGEPLLNQNLIKYWPYFKNFVYIEAKSRDLIPIIKISTIIPWEIKTSPRYEFENNILNKFTSGMNSSNVHMYWSLYSVEEDFRKRWLPKAMDIHLAAEFMIQLKQRGIKVVIHSAFIEGENNHPISVDRIIRFLKYYDLLDGFNIVRYNPPNDKSKEAENLIEIHRMLNKATKGNCQLVPRVGYDVKASCGMFIS